MNKDELESVAATLKATPPPPREEAITARQAVKELWPEIKRLLDAGHNQSQVAAMLQGRVPGTFGSLRVYVAEAIHDERQAAGRASAPKPDLHKTYKALDAEALQRACDEAMEAGDKDEAHFWRNVLDVYLQAKATKVSEDGE